MGLETEYEFELTEKLLKTFHLNALERKNLPEGKLRLSVILMVIKQILISKSYFPVTWRPDTPFAGGLLKDCQTTRLNYIIKRKYQLAIIS